ncbi:hypothetical protein B0H19DRAFT_1345650 [Mycena capillaripes]|nr:hypothetical protein B0H19DRAFT_1345650 [Mycena capillaripes]
MTRNYDQNHPSVFRLPVDGTAVLNAVRGRDGMPRRSVAQGRDGTVVHPSVRLTVLDGFPSRKGDPSNPSNGRERVPRRRVDPSRTCPGLALARGPRRPGKTPPVPSVDPSKTGTGWSPRKIRLQKKPAARRRRSWSTRIVGGGIVVNRRVEDASKFPVTLDHMHYTRYSHGYYKRKYTISMDMDMATEQTLRSEAQFIQS